MPGTGMPEPDVLRPQRIGFLEAVCRELDGFDDLPVAGAAADIAGDRLDDLLAARRVGMLQQCMRGQDHARRAVTALQTVGLAERILNDAEFTRGRRETFDRGDLVAIGLHRKHQT